MTWGWDSEMLTCETKLLEVILPRDWAVRDTVHERTQDWTAARFVDAKDVWPWGSGSGRMVRVRLCEWRRWCRWDVHVSRCTSAAAETLKYRRGGFVLYDRHPVLDS